MTYTGVYGGSFNPIHKGHVQIADPLCKQEEVDEIWFLVSPRNPFKQKADDLLDEDRRLELARLAVKDHPHLKVCDFEFSLPRPSYTVDTLAALRQAYPDRRFTLIIGADNWLTFNRWKQPDDILRHHRVLIYPRPGYPINPSALPAGVTLADTPLIALSSTELRRHIARGEDASYGLDEAVWQEIRRKGYYQKR
ncbi:MAG: nicotinate-nucleotide adenylyltransferase [Paraprevotella sp.]|nr:nicotinate-nucleotide adenylyltransferase [Paraprevotella sp.]